MVGRFSKLRRNIINNLSSWEVANTPIWNLTVEVTYKCNAKCGFCQRWKDGKSMDKKMLEDILKQADGLSVNVVITGGEPLVYPNLIKIIKKYRRSSYDIHICTNGIKISEMATEISEVADHVMVSLDSNVPEIHDSIRGVNGVFERAVEGIKKLKSLGVSVHTQSVITDKNIDHIDKVYEFSVKELGCDHLAQPVHNEVGTKLAPLEGMNFDKEEVNKKCVLLSKLAKKYLDVSWLQEVYYGLTRHFLIDPNRLSWMKCPVAGKDLLFVDPDGKVSPCETRRDVNLGNLRDTDLKTILDEEVPKFRKRLKTEKCVCLWGCTADNMIKYQFRPFGDYAYGIPTRMLWKKKIKELERDNKND